MSSKPKIRLRRGNTDTQEPAAKNDAARDAQSNIVGAVEKVTAQTEEPIVVMSPAEPNLMQAMDADRTMRSVATRSKEKKPQISSTKATVNAAKNTYINHSPNGVHHPNIDFSDAPFIPDEMHAFLYAQPHFQVPFDRRLWWVPVASMVLSLWHITAILQIMFIALWVRKPIKSSSILKNIVAYSMTWVVANYAIPQYTVYIISTVLLLRSAYDVWCDWSMDAIKHLAFSVPVIMSLCLEYYYPIIPFVSILPIIYMCLLQLLPLYIFNMEYRRSLILHPCIELSNEDSKIHWFLLCLRLGLPGLSKQHSSISRHVCGIDASDDDQLVVAVSSWLGEEHPSLQARFGNEAVSEIAKYICEKNRDWILRGAPLHALAHFTQNVANIYYYDRYMRPLVSKFVWKYAGLTEEVLQKSSEHLWRPSAALKKNTLSSLWSQPQVARNPRLICKNLGLYDLLKTFQQHQNTPIALIFSFMVDMSQLLYYDALAKSAYIGTVCDMIANSPWLSGIFGGSKDPVEQEHNTDNAAADDAKQPPLLQFIKRLALIMPFYLTRDEAEQVFENVFGASKSLTKSPRLDACLFYGPEYLASEM